jgi:hypothetical protein
VGEDAAGLNASMGALRRSVLRAVQTAIGQGETY